MTSIAVLFLTLLAPDALWAEAYQAPKDCNSAGQNIVKHCSQETQLVTGQQLRKLGSLLDSNRSGLEVSKNVESEAQQTQKDLGVSIAICQQALGDCQTKCEGEINQAKSQAQQYRSMPNNSGLQAALQLEGHANNLGKVLQHCQADAASATESREAVMAQAADLAKQAAAIITALGGIIGGNGDGNFDSASLEEEDECSGEFAESLIACRDQSEIDPKGTRAALAGTGAQNAQGGSSGFFGATPGEEGEPGGTAQGNNNGSPVRAASSGFGNGLGSNGLGANSGTGSGRSDGKGGTGLNTNLGSGFHSASSSGSAGGGFSGGGGAPLGRGFQSASANPAGSPQGALQNRLNQFAASSNEPTRGLASDKGAGGPFDYNWKTVRDAYKKNVGTMYHQP